MAIKRSFILSSGLGVSADNIFVVNNTNSVSSTTGSIISTGGVGIGQSVSIGGRLQLFNSSDYTAFQSSASGNTVYTLPATSPATGSSVLQSTSAGVMSWVPMTATSGSSGLATTAQNLNTVAATTNATHYILFSPINGGSGVAVSSDAGLFFNPSSNSLTTNTFTAGVSIATVTASVSGSTASTSPTTGALVVTGGVGIGGSLYVAGDLTINGTTTTINSVTLTVDDKNIELGSVTSPSDVTAEGGGITLRGATDKSINWYTGTGWSSSESWNLVSGNTYKINNTTVLSNSSLGTGVTNSSLTALGTITTGVWAGTSITAYYGGTGLQTSFTVGDLLYANTTSTWNRLSPGVNGYILTSAGTANTPSYANPATLTIGTATTATNINVVTALTNASHPLLFTPTSGSASGLAVSSNTTLVYNPSTDILSVSGMAVTSSTASTSATTGSLIATGGVGIGQSASIGGRLQLFNSVNYTAFVSSASGNTVYTLPATSPATGSSVLQSTSAGVMSWVPMTAASSSGNTTQNIVINSAGNANVFHPILFTPSSQSAGSAVSSDSTISFNPSTEILNVSGLAITSGTASTNTTTGALVVRGGLGVTGQLSFAQASFGFTGITSNPTMSFIGATSASPITLTVLTDNSLNFEGSQGSVFSLDSNLSSGEIFSVSDISGLPIISASAGQTVNINEFGGFTQIGNGTINSSSTSTGSLVIAGGLGMTGNANFGGTVLISNSTQPLYGSTSSGALVVTGGVGVGGSVYIGGQLGIGGTLDYSASGNVSYFAGNINSYNQVIVHNHNAGNNASSDFVVSNDSTTDTTFFGDFGMNSSGWAATTSAYNTANAVYLASNSGDLAIGSLTANPIRFFYNNGTSDAVVFGGIAATVNYGTNSSSTISGALQVKGGLGITGNAFIGGTTTVSNTTASTSITSGALSVSGGVGIGQSVSVGGRIQLFNGTNYTALVSSATGNTVYTLPATSPATGTSVLVSTSAGVWSWASPSSVGNSSGGTTDGTVQYKAGSGFAGTNSFFYDTTLYALILSNFPAGETTSSTSAALKVEQTTSSFNGSLNGTMIAVNANNGFTGDLLNLQTNAISKFRVDANGAIGTSSDIVSVSTTASTNTTSGALQVRGGAGIAQTLFVGGNISSTNYLYSGGNNFTKSGQAQGDIFLDNNTNDTPGLLYYYKNNTNFGVDVYAVGIGATRLRIVRDLNESTGSEIWSIDRTGVVTRSAWDVGEVINTRVYNNSDLGMSATTTINSTTYTNVAVITYTPKSSTSHLWIEFDANYDYSNGTTTDDFFSRITVGGSVISEKNQIMVGQIGGGTRSGVIFPISGRYTNSSTSGIAITVQAKWGTADDAIRVYGSSTSGYMRIQEIGR